MSCGQACLPSFVLARESSGRLARWLAALVACCLCVTSLAQAQIELPVDVETPIVATARLAHVWQKAGVEIWLLDGECHLEQGDLRMTCERAVLWIDRGDPLADRTHNVTCYCEGAVEVESRGGRIADETYVSTLRTYRQIDLRALDVRQTSAEDAPLFERARERRVRATGSPRVRSVKQTQVETLPEPGAAGGPVVAAPGSRRMRALPRNGQGYQLESRPTGRGAEQVTVLTQGITLLIDGADFGSALGGGAIDVSTDRMVIWSEGGLDLSGQSNQDGEKSVEIYMEGNIVFRQGERTIYAERMYYDVKNEIGIVLDAEMYTVAPELNAPIRVRADLLRQVARDRFYAQRGSATTSMLALPTYRWESGDLTIEDRQQPAFQPYTGQPIVDPETGQQLIEHRQYITASNNFVYLGTVPVFYVPYLAGDPKDISYLPGIRFKNDQIFGTQILTEFDMYKTLGIAGAPGTEWNVNVDFMSERGLGHGSNFIYRGQDIAGIPGSYFGLLDYWGINDQGLDNLGAGRIDMTPDKEYRYRLFGRHRHRFENDIQLTGELGWIGERNFLEQYYENEWDLFKDQTTGIELKQLWGNQAWSLWTDAQVNSFLTQTAWLPRADHFWLGQSLLGNRLTYYEHTQIAYAEYGVATTPTDPQDALPFALRPYEENARGERFATRHELDLPVNLGAVNIVPYVLGEFAHWGEDLEQESLDRVYGQVGIRGSLPFWAAYPDVQSQLLNLNGIAHKVVLRADAYHAESNQGVDQLPLYDAIDDDSTEHFRHRFPFYDFGGIVPPQFDERQYAIRDGIGGWVAGPTTELADDLDVIRLGALQRWQTKRGPIDNPHIIDYITLDTQISLYPDKTRDNFDELLGLAQYDFRWYIGDRLSVYSNGGYDFFEQGQKSFAVGSVLARPPKGRVQVEFRYLDGPIIAQVLNASYDYQFSPKWSGLYGYSYDFANNGFEGHNVALTRIGESFVARFGANFNSSKDSLTFMFTLEPRFFSGGKIVRAATAVPPAGAAYLD